VPVLLNVEYTAPYMHDGRFKTLEEVVEHYSTGVKNHPNLPAVLRDFDFNNEKMNIPPQKLNFTSVEKKCLVDFLKTLSDPSILTDVRFKNPFTNK
jgi:cytochrome c peroxidase